ncbi:MAG: hypothetical protein ACRC92_12035 [Peptostreptococcaceae bacterium]
MELKRSICAVIAFSLLLTGVACTKKETTPTPETPTTENVALDEKYVENYSKYYNDYMVGLGEYKMYETPATVTEYYTTNEYPGNEVYLTNLKTAYQTTRDKMESFVTSLKNDVTTEDEALKQRNEELIKSGEQTITNIDTKLKQLEEYPKENMNLAQEEFIKSVNEVTTVKDEVKTDFNKMLQDMNKTLGIQTNK